MVRHRKCGVLYRHVALPCSTIDPRMTAILEFSLSQVLLITAAPAPIPANSREGYVTERLERIEGRKDQDGSSLIWVARHGKCAMRATDAAVGCHQLSASHSPLERYVC